VGVVLAAYVGLAVQDIAPRIWEIGRDSIAVRVESDPRRFLSDLPFRWARFDYVFERPVSQLRPPPELCHHRFAWARGLGGVDADRTTARVYLEGREPKRTVQLNQFRVDIERKEKPLEGVHAACPVGGATPRVRSLAIDLDLPAACFTNSDGQCVRRLPAFVLAEGDVEVFDVTATTKECFCSWTVQLDYSVGEDEHTVEITAPDGEPFETTATSRSKPYSYAGDRWYRGEHLGPPR
jgi:hypothetical protein